ncbi:MAG: gfa [Devosia sp.]|nr:gfa [Devosia sp.]
MSYDIACPCGACIIRIAGEPQVQFYCHCDDCRAISGGAYIGVVAFAAADVTVIQGEPQSWTLRSLPRQRCPNCGVQLTATVVPGKLTGVKANLLPPGKFKPILHQQCGLAVLPVIDNLPHYRGTPAMWGGSDDLVGW